MMPVGANDYVQLVQTRDYFVIYTELVHDARIVPLDADHISQTICASGGRIHAANGMAILSSSLRRTSPERVPACSGCSPQESKWSAMERSTKTPCSSSVSDV